MKKIYFLLVTVLHTCSYSDSADQNPPRLPGFRGTLIFYKPICAFFFSILAFSIVNCVNAQIESCPSLVHNSYTDFNASGNSGTPTTLWFNLHTKLSSNQLTANGDFLLFSGGTLSFSGVGSSFGSSVSLPKGEIIADNSISVPATSFNSGTNMWITRVPLAYSSSDLFLSGAAITSTTGYTLSGGGKSTTLSGNIYSNKPISSSWFYGLACYQPTFTNTTAGAVNADNGIPVGGRQTGTPTGQLSGLVQGGSGGGGSNYTGSYSSTDNYTTCIAPLKFGSYVWNDLNSNGIRDAGEPGINGATVYLFLDANHDNVPDGSAIDSTFTDLTGIYSISGLLPGNYIIGVNIPKGYSPGVTTATSVTPNNNDSTDNNGVNLIGSNILSNSITLAEGTIGTLGVLTVDFGLKFSINTLPLVISDFEAYANTDDKKVILKWVTETELNNTYFSVERSQDNKSFSDLGLAQGSIDSSSVKAYEFDDDLKNVDIGKLIYYRVKQTGSDGKNTYSAIRIVKLSNNVAGSKVYPNPFIDKIIINFNSATTGVCEFRIINMDGQSIVSGLKNIQGGFNNFAINNLGSLKKGSYVLELITNGKVCQKVKLMKN